VIIYRKVKKEDLNQIAKIHKEAFPDYFLTAFGEELLYEFYNQYFLNNNIFVVAEENNKIIGFILGNNSDIPRKKFFNENFYRISLKVIFELLKLNKNLWNGIFQRVFFVKEAIISKFRKNIKIEERIIQNKKSYRLLSIAVNPKVKGKNIAVEMEKYFCEELLKIGIEEVGLSVKKENIRAIKFYEKCGYFLEREEEKSKYFNKKLVRS